MHRESYVLVFTLVNEKVLTHAIIRWEFRAKIILSLGSLAID